MKTKTKNFGLTLVELLVAVALLVILASMVMLAASTSWKAISSEPTKAAINLLDSALQEYYDYYGSFPSYKNVPIDDDTLRRQFHSANLYLRLSLCPDSKKVLETIPDSMIEKVKPTGHTGPGTNFFVFLDSWGTAIDYQYDPNLTFPVIISAGPDKIFGTADDITNKK